MIELVGTPYLVAAGAAQSLGALLRDLDDRVSLLRHTGRLTPETLRLYYRQTKFEQIAESNALEGSTLSVGETEQAVLHGITFTGHDPAYVRDARTLAQAHDRAVELARTHTPVDLAEVKQIHALVLGDRPGAGLFRREEVHITQSAHHPPATLAEVRAAMDQWATWSQEHPSVPAALRAIVLHAWLTHIHPFIDGNGRTARAIGNLELIRAGLPPIIIRKVRHRARYIEALQVSDTGDLSLFIDLILERIEDALRDLERAAAAGQGYDVMALRIRRARDLQLGIWTAAVQLLVELIRARLEASFEGQPAKVGVHVYRDALTLDDYITLCERHPIRGSWLFRLDVEVVGVPRYSRLAWAGFRSDAMSAAVGADAMAGPTIFWSRPNPAGFPPWVQAPGPRVDEMTLVGDPWKVLGAGDPRWRSSSQLADDIVRGVLDDALP